MPKKKSALVDTRVIYCGDIDAFETAMRRADCKKGFFVGFDYSQDAMNEIQRYFTKEHRIIVPLTVNDILDEQIAMKLA